MADRVLAHATDQIGPCPPAERPAARVFESRVRPDEWRRTWRPDT